jgi:hypothetical protein
LGHTSPLAGRSWKDGRSFQLRGTRLVGSNAGVWVAVLLEAWMKRVIAKEIQQGR